MDPVSSRLPNDLLLTQWSQQINQLLKIPMLSGLAISNISLVANTPTTFQTKIERKQQGWFLTDNSANAVVWRTKDFNAETLTLESSATTIISIWVY